MKPQHRTNENLVSLCIAVLIFGASALLWGQVEQTKPEAVVLSPDWFHCPYCTKSEQYLKGEGLEVTVLKLSREQSKGLSIKGFPTVLLGGELVVGHDPAKFGEALR